MHFVLMRLYCTSNILELYERNNRIFLYSATYVYLCSFCICCFCFGFGSVCFGFGCILFHSTLAEWVLLINV